MSVAAASPAVLAMEECRRLPRALMGGTAAMRLAGQEYLPKEIAESDAAYKSRLRRSFLFNGFGKTVRDMAGKVFGRPVVIGDDTPPELVAMAENIDLTGRNLDVFAHAVFCDALADGISYVMIDMDAPLAIGGRVPTRAETAGRRPWAVHVKARQVLGWRSETISGVETLTQFRFKELVFEDDGLFGQKSVDQIRALIRDGAGVRWETHRKDDKVEWLLHDEGMMTIAEIPVAPVYVARTGFFQGVSPLADLADVNLAHWQSQSDQRNILHVARVPILFGAGLADTGPLEIGAARMIRASDPGATLRYVEHSGAAIGSGHEDLKDLEFQMQTLGLELLIPRPGGQTATGAAIDQARMNAPLTMMASALKDALEQSFGFMATFAGLPSGGSLVVNTDFGTGLNGAADGTVLLQAVTAGALSRATFLREMKRRGVLSEDVDVENEVLDAMNEGTDDAML